MRVRLFPSTNLVSLEIVKVPFSSLIFASLFPGCFYSYLAWYVRTMRVDLSQLVFEVLCMPFFQNRNKLELK